MLIKNVAATAFGRLKDWQSPDFSPKLTVLYGHNEAGKSTLFNLIVTLLYGWKPVKDNDYIPWGGEAPLIRGNLATDDGQELEVSRRLRSQAEGTLTLGGRNISLRNDSIPQVAFMSREVFQEIYALGPDQLRFPDQSAWQKLQDQLLGGQYGSFLRPVATVLSELDNEASGFWRPDRRGNPRSKVLNGEIKDLQQRIREAENNEQALRSLEAELDELINRQQQLKETKVRLTALLRRYHLLIPLRRQLQRWQELKTKAGDVDGCDFLPAQPRQEMDGLQAEVIDLTRKRDTLKERVGQAKAVADAYTDADRQVIALGSVIRPLIRRSGQLQSILDQQQELRQKLELNRQRLQDRAGQFLKGGWRDQLAETVTAVDEVELKAAIDAFNLKNQEQEKAAAQLEGLKSAPDGDRRLRFSKKTPLAALMILLLGIAGSLLGGVSPLGIGSALVGAFGIILLVLYSLSARGGQEGGTASRIEEIKERLAALEEACLFLRQQVREALRGLPVAEQRLDAPDGSLLVDIKDLKILLRQQGDILRDIANADKHLAETASALEEPVRVCNLKAGLSLPESIELLEQRLMAAEERRQQAAAAEKERLELLTRLKEVEFKLTDTQENLQKLQEGVAGLPGDSVEEKLQALTERRRARQQAETLENELQRQYPDLEQLKAEIGKAEAAGESWVNSEEAEVRAQMELEESDEELNRVSNRIGSVQSELSSRQQQERLDDLQGQLSCLQEELAQAARERDRLLLLHNLLASADKSFREEHQPDVLLKAGRYLDIITGGRYSRLSVKEDGSGLELQSSYYDYPLEVKPPLSRGTLEQVYLALRLALVEHLDAGGERLPLFLDEVLVNWDGTRLERGLKLLEEVSGERQVFLFTCHDWLGDALQTKAQIITL